MRRDFFADLKCGNVYKVAVAYAVVSWLLIQAASILLPTLNAPNRVMKPFVVFLIFAVGAGFGYRRPAFHRAYAEVSLRQMRERSFFRAKADQ